MKKIKRWGKILLCVVLALVLLVGAYVAYVLIDYHRIGDMELPVQGEEKSLAVAMDTDKSYTVLSYITLALVPMRATTASLWMAARNHGLGARNG